MQTQEKDKYIIIGKVDIKDILKQKKCRVNPFVELIVKSLDEQGINSLRINIERIREVKPGYYKFNAFITSGFFMRGYYYPELSDVSGYLSDEEPCYIQISTMCRVDRSAAPAPRNSMMQKERERVLEKERMLFTKWKHELNIAN